MLDKYPQVLNWINEDQDKFGKGKKRDRILDKKFEENRTKSIIPEEKLKEFFGENVDAEKLELQTGRNRMQPISDAKELKPVLEQAFERTGVVSKMVSTDDGYPSEENKKWLLDMGSETINFNGPTGRKLTSDEEWKSTAYQIARSERSMIEGLFSTLKTVQGFGKLSRRGLENGKKELLEKVIVHNFYRIGILRKRREEEMQLKNIKIKEEKKTIIQSVYRVAIEPLRKQIEKAAA